MSDARASGFARDYGFESGYDTVRVHHGPNREQRRAIERQIAERAQAAYQRTIADWQRQPRTPART